MKRIKSYQAAFKALSMSSHWWRTERRCISYDRTAMKQSNRNHLSAFRFLTSRANELQMRFSGFALFLIFPSRLSTLRGPFTFTSRPVMLSSRKPNQVFLACKHKINKAMLSRVIKRLCIWMPGRGRQETNKDLTNQRVKADRQHRRHLRCVSGDALLNRCSFHEPGS